MNLFTEIEGLRGETLTSAVLRYLLLRSSGFREAFLTLISDVCPTGPIAPGTRFGCDIEEPTDDDKAGKGRLDLVIETGDRVIGVENKLFAHFQDEQPKKYLKSIESRARGLHGVYSKEFQPLLVVLAPQRREPEIRMKVEEQGIQQNLYAFLSWQAVMGAIDDCMPEMDSESVAVAGNFKEYLERTIGFMPDFAKWVPHLNARFDDRGTELQRAVVSRLWYLFPNPGGRLSSGKWWCGYYFNVNNKPGYGWYGFLPLEEIYEGAKNPAELVVVTPFEVGFDKDVFRPIKIRKEGENTYLGPDYHKEFAWAVNLDKSMSDPNRWIEALKPLVEIIESAKDEL